MKKLIAYTQALVVAANTVRKALIAAAAVLVTIQATSGVPSDAKAVAANLLAALAAFGVTYKVSNKPAV